MPAPKTEERHKEWRQKLSKAHQARLGDPRIRFWRKVEKTDTCWLWRGSTFRQGYGQFKINGKNLQTHRVVYEWTFGPILPGFLVCHRCDVPLCVRPDHLFLGSVRDNVLDSVRKGRNPFTIDPPMRHPDIAKKNADARRGKPRPFMLKGKDGRFIGRKP